MAKKLRYDAKEYAEGRDVVLKEMASMGKENVQSRTVQEMIGIIHAETGVKMSAYRMDTTMRKFLGLPKTGKLYTPGVAPAGTEWRVKYTPPKMPGIEAACAYVPSPDPVPSVETVMTRLARIEQKLNQLLNALGVA